MLLTGQKIVVGVTGGIAVYKAVDLVSRLRKQGASVKVVMTEAATKFVTPLTFRELSANPVVVSMWSEAHEFNVEHIALACWADLFIVAPATANIIAKMATGIADDMLSTTLLATKAQIVVCPAMNTNMYEHPLTQANFKKLTDLGYKIMPAAEGYLACGTSGAGRLPEPQKIVEYLEQLIAKTQDLLGLNVLITAAGTREAIDPVRYISNHSSGKMGYAIAKTALERGANVTLISGPSNLTVPVGVNFVAVDSAREMHAAVLASFFTADIVIKAAAVADYRPQAVSLQKIKKCHDENLTLILERNPDILADLGQKKTTQFLVGFAAETNDLISNAQEKLRKKNLDMIVANDVTLTGAGFNADTNIVKFLYPDGEICSLEQMSKLDVAATLLDSILAKRKLQLAK